MKERSLERKAHRIWGNIKARCHTPTNRDYPNYGGRGVTMCEEWRNDSKAFVKWYKENYYEIENGYMMVDKDILKGSQYSPETCLIVPVALNNLFVGKHNGDMRGLQKRGQVWEVKVKNPITKKNDYCGRYEDVEIAQSVYKKCKKAIIVGMAEEYKERVPEKVYRALIEYEF